MTTCLKPVRFARMATTFENFESSLSESTPFAHVKNLQQLGGILREARLNSNQTIEKIALILRLKPYYLEAIEIGDWDALPSATYGRGYLRHYAEYLNFSPQEATECCLRIQGKVEAKLNYHKIHTTYEIPSRGTLWFSAFGLLGLCVIWLSLANLADNRERLAPPLVDPQMADESQLSDYIAPLSQNVLSTCLNIPSRSIEICETSTDNLPSFILKNPTIYPIWKRE